MVEVPVIRYRSLPFECFDSIPFAVLEDGATNEDLARAYRDALLAAQAHARLALACRELNAGRPAGTDQPPP